jgi:hypothetical protein
VWDIRYLYGTRSWLGVEGSYVGSAASGSDALGTGAAITNQFTGNLRFNVLRRRIQPFVTAGAGWARLTRGNPSNASGAAFSESVHSFDAPFGAGIAAYAGKNFVVDARGTYSIITNKDFTNTGARPDMWTAQLRAGYAF